MGLFEDLITSTTRPPANVQASSPEYRMGTLADLAGIDNPLGTDPMPLPQASDSPGRSPEDIMNLLRQANEINALYQGMSPLDPGQEPLPMSLPEYDMMGERKGYTPPEKEPLPMSLPEYDMMGRRKGEKTEAAPVQDTPAEDKSVEEAKKEDPGMSPQDRALALRILSGLTQAGREMAATPTLSEIQRGQRRRAPEQEKLLSGAAQRLEEGERVKKAEAEAEQKAIEKGKTDPLVTLAKKQGIEANTREEAVSGLQLQKLISGIERTQAETDAVRSDLKGKEKQAVLSAELAQRRATGDLTALTDETKKELTKAEEALSKDKNYSNYLAQAQSASQIKNLLEQGGELAFRGMPVILARAMGEVGNLSKTEQDAYRKLIGLEGEIASWVEWWTSTPDEERLAAMEKLANAFELNAVPKVQDAVERRAGSFIRKYGNEAPEEVLREHFQGFGIPERIRSAEAPEEGAQPTYFKLSNGETRKTNPGESVKVGDTYTDGGESVSVIEVLD